MNSQSCARRTLGLFARSLTDRRPSFGIRLLHNNNSRPSDPFPDARPSRQSQKKHNRPSDSFPDARPPRPHYKKFNRSADPSDGPRPSQRAHDTLTRSPKAVATTTFDESTAEWSEGPSNRPAWQVEKEAMKRKLNGEAWNPRKKLSPDTMEGIRHLHETQPTKFTTPVLAEHFKVSSEAIRRILKSKWRPSDEEHDERTQRWDKRGERIWSNLVEMGIKPPKKWREMGVGRADNGDRRPIWKSRNRNQIDIMDSAPEAFLPEEDIIPTVDASGNRKTKITIPLSERL